MGNGEWGVEGAPTGHFISARDGVPGLGAGCWRVLKGRYMWGGLSPTCSVRFDVVGDGDGAGEAHGEMDVVGDAADPVDFAARMSAECGEVGEEFGSDDVVEPGMAVFGGEDEMEVDAVEGEGRWCGAIRICSSR